jgi:4-hydroxy-2-oxoglutarate aldolase
VSKPLEGIYIALTTPFAGERISPEKMSGNVRKYNRTDVTGYLVLGSTGESVFLTDAESEKLIAAVAGAAARGRKILAGTARESTRATAEFTRRAARFGIAAALVRPPSYFKSKMTRESLKSHFLAVADASPVPILIYNIPQNTGLSLDPRLVVELAGHPNVAGIKESAGSLGFLGEVVRDVPRNFQYFAGSGHVVYPSLEMGAAGAILALANAVPELCAQLFRFFKEGKRDAARKLQLDLVPLNKTIVEKHGIAGVKAAQDLRGYYGGPARRPLLPLDAASRDEIAALLHALPLPPA